MFASIITTTLFFSTISVTISLRSLFINQQTSFSERRSLITFDDITNTTDTPGVPVPNNYGGLNWENVLVLNGLNFSNPGTGYRTGVVSPPYLAFNGYGSPMTIESATASKLFTAHSFYSCAVWYDNITLTMTGSRSGTILFTKTVSLFIQNRTLVELNWPGIDSIHLTSICYWCCDAKHFTMDNLVVTF
ncbi:unnamed protein product [Rotaria magnacalcarata]|uniref:Uncharacterized protein n=3 Tax=Rotaria magnacalcarata TaxID=392030 RepID=A0A815SCN0_9BILA|nr:unnamed protein product [Rotaria magnacalcarata]CAF2267292.1 unnamed protein product [Rotaria magnacalcarata]